MSKEITIILSKANWCPHCRDFEPIFELAKKNSKSDDYLKNYDIKFEDYDFEDNNVKNTFSINHFDAMDKISGYPTILLKIVQNKKNNYIPIEHTVINLQTKSEKNKKILEQDASKRFLNNIINCLKTIDSDRKVLFMETHETQTGGNMTKFNSKQNLSENELYKKKYLKYKSKYLELKKI